MMTRPFTRFGAIPAVIALTIGFSGAAKPARFDANATVTEARVAVERHQRRRATPRAAQVVDAEPLVMETAMTRRGTRQRPVTQDWGPATARAALAPQPTRRGTRLRPVEPAVIVAFK